MSMNSLMKRIDTVYVNTGGDSQGSKENTKPTDPFKQGKLEIHSTLKRVRENIKLRDELLEKQPTETSTIEKGQQIRRDLKSAKDLSNQLRDDLAKERKKKIGKLPQEELDSRQEQLELISKHIEECDRLEKQRYQHKQKQEQKGSSDMRSRLLTSQVATSSSKSSEAIDDFHPATSSSLPPIQVEEQIQILKKRDAQLDEGLDVISQGVMRIKQVATTIGDELDTQNAMLDEIETKVDKANIHLLNINRKMKDTLSKVKGADRFIMNFVLLMVFLGIAAYIWHMLS